MKAGWIIGLALAAVAALVYALAPFGARPSDPASGATTANTNTTQGAAANATLDPGSNGQAASERDAARQPAALSGEVRDPRRAEPEKTFGSADGEPPPLVEITGVLPNSGSVHDIANAGLLKTIEARYQRADAEARRAALEALSQRYEQYLAGKTPEGEKGLDENGIEQLQIEMEWLLDNPGS